MNQRDRRPHTESDRVPVNEIRARYRDILEENIERRYSIRVAEKSTFYFDGRANSLQDITLAQTVDSSDWASGTLQVQWYGQLGMSTTASVQVLVRNAYLSEDDPRMYFQNTTAVAASSTFIWSTSARIDTAAFVPPIGPQLRVVLRFSQGAVLASAQQAVQLGVMLVGRPV